MLHRNNMNNVNMKNEKLENNSMVILECISDSIEIIDEYTWDPGNKRPSSSHELKDIKDPTDSNNVSVYCVKPGDTIERVAAKFKTTPTTLMAMNKLNSRTIFINQKLKVNHPIKTDGNNLTVEVSEEKEDSSKMIKKLMIIDKCSSDTMLLPLHCKSNHLKVESKYITDSEGIIKGKLLLNPVFFTFIPAFSDPVVMEYGDENFTIHLPNNKIACVSMYADSEMMAYKRSQRKDMTSKIYSPTKPTEPVSPSAARDDVTVIDKSLNNYLTSNSLTDFFNHSDYVHDIERLKNLKFVDHKYLCVVASPRYRKIKAVYQKEDEYWFMVPTDSAQELMDYFLNHAQTIYDVGADVDPNANWQSDNICNDTSLPQMTSRSSFAKVADIDGLFKNTNTKINSSINKLRRKSIQWEIVNTDIDFQLNSFNDSQEVHSKIIDSAKVHELTNHLPADTIGATWELIYSTDRDGWSLATLYRHVYNSTRGCCLLLIKDSSSAIFGALCNSYIRISSSFYGNGTSFVFRWSPRFEKFSYSHKNHYLLYGQPGYFSIGCSNCSHAIRIEKNLFSGITQACDTFDSPPLVTSETFDVAHLEVWSFY